MNLQCFLCLVSLCVLDVCLLSSSYSMSSVSVAVCSFLFGVIVVCSLQYVFLWLANSVFALNQTHARITVDTHISPNTMHEHCKTHRTH